MAPIDHTLADSQIGAGFGITTLPHLREFAISGPFKVTGISETPSRRKHLHLPSDVGRRGGRVRERDRPQARDAGVSRAAVGRRHRRPDEVLRAGPQGGRDFESGIRMALQAILASPRFLFRLEEAPATLRAGQNYRITDLDLASRLSFFLWGAGPDEELLKVAQRGTLRGPGVLAAQVKRMLADPRSEALSTRFASQWLRLQDLEKIDPDALLFPYYDYKLGEALKQETELFFDSIVREDRSMLDLLTADYTFVNERVAKHYGIPNVNGPDFRRVTLADENRRGMLGQGSILALTSVADRTSPVLRGKWVMEVLLGSPPPPPPPNVPTLDETKAEAGDVMLSTRAAHGAAPREPAVHLVPPRDRSAGPRARELRRHRPLAHPRQRRAGRSGRRAVRRHQDDRPGRPARRAAQAPGHVLPELHREPDDLRLGRRVESVRHARDSRDRPRRGEGQQPFSAFVLGVVNSRAFQMSRADERRRRRQQLTLSR